MFILRLLPAVLLAALFSVRAPAREVPITILHTTDMHGHLLPGYLYSGEGNRGGLLRCASAIAGERARHLNTLLVDCGDTIQGGAETVPSRGGLMVRAMNHLAYDAWVLGNHEFDWGLNNLRELLEQSNAPMLAANVTTVSGHPASLPSLKPYLLREVDGVRLALIGLTTPGIPSWFLPESFGDLLFKGSVESLAPVLEELKAVNPDIYILLVHQGHTPSGDGFANQVNAIAARFPELDVIIGGHTHTPIEMNKVNRSIYTQAGYHANWLGRVELVFDTVQDRLIQRRADLVEIGDRYATHPKLAEALEPELSAIRKQLQTVIGEAAQPVTISSGYPGQSGQQALIARSIQYALPEVDIVLHGRLSTHELPAGPIRDGDLWRIIPYENRVAVLSLLPQELRAILEENAGKYKRHGFLGVAGMTYELHAGKPRGERVQALRLSDGTSLHPRKRYKVAVNSHVLAGGGRRHHLVREAAFRPEARMQYTKLETRALVRQYIRDHQPLAIEAAKGAVIVRKPPAGSP